MKKMQININEINKECLLDTNKFINECENKYNEKINSVADYIKSNIDSSKIVLISGPSSSGKTTTSKILINKLEEKGIHSITVSTDDFFVNRWETPKNEDGSYDYENIKATNLSLLKSCVKELIENKEAYFPTYDFITGESKLHSNKLELNDNTIIIIEGIHALNPILTEDFYFQKSLKIYVCVFSNFVKDENVILEAKNLRLTRRILRDSATRGFSPERSIELWNNVLKGEELYIKPFINSANFVIDTTHPYEALVYKDLITKKLINISNEISKSLLDSYHNFESIDKKYIPKNSLLNEFVF